MKKIITYCLLSSLLFVGSCQKNKLPKVEDSGSPVFYVKCQVNGVPLNLNAGLDNYEMKSSYYQDKITFMFTSHSYHKTVLATAPAVMNSLS